MSSKVAELAMERQALAEQLRAIDTDIHTLESARRILEGHRTATVPASKPRKSEDGSMPNLERGDFTRAVLETLRESKRPLTAMEVGDGALARLGLALDVMTRSALSARVCTIAKTHVTKGTLRRIDRPDEHYRLEIAR